MKLTRENRFGLRKENNTFFGVLDLFGVKDYGLSLLLIVKLRNNGNDDDERACAPMNNWMLAECYFRLQLGNGSSFWVKSRNLREGEACCHLPK